MNLIQTQHRTDCLHEISVYNCDHWKFVHAFIMDISCMVDVCFSLWVSEYTRLLALKVYHVN